MDKSDKLCSSPITIKSTYKNMKKALVVDIKKSPDGTFIASVLPSGETVLQKASPEAYKFFKIFEECYVSGCNCNEDGTTWGNHIPTNKVEL